MNKAELLLHPVRLRIVQVMSKRTLTASQLAQLLPEVPHTTLYRHINLLVEGGLLTVVEERQVRNLLEKVYAFVEEAANLMPEDYEQASKEDHLRYFTGFVTAILADFDRYLRSQDQMPVTTAGVFKRQEVLYLSKEEYRQVMMQLRAAVLPFENNGPAPERQRMAFSLITIPLTEDEE